MRGLPLLLLIAGCSSVPQPPTDRAPYADLLKDATRLRIRSGGLCHRVPAEERTLVTVNEAVTVRKVAGYLRIPPSLYGEVTRCRCCGDPTLEFFRGEQFIVAVGLHHGTRIRSDAIGDEELTKTAARQLCGWLADAGVPEPEASRRRIHDR